MLHITAGQMSILVRRSFYGKLDQFVRLNALRDDWRNWMADAIRTHALWDSVWSKVSQHSEHDCALYLVGMAIRAFESDTPKGCTTEEWDEWFADPSPNEVAIKRWIATRGYLRFTAFDYPAVTEQVLGPEGKTGINSAFNTYGH